jgi:uncharacterized membrane protein YfhO
MQVNAIHDINQYQTSIYSSTSNLVYNNFYYDIFNNSMPYRTKATMVPVNNPLFQILMGHKYVIPKDSAVENATLLKEKNGIRIYSKKDVLPIGYASNHILSVADFGKLTYPNNVIALLNNVVVGDTSSNSITTDIKEERVDYDVLKTKDIIYQRQGNGYKVTSSANDASINLGLNDDDLKQKIVCIRFKINNAPTKKKNEVSITINGNRNKLSHTSWKYYNNNIVFDYTFYGNNELNIKFTKGIYNISNIKMYVIDYKEISNSNKLVDEFIFDKNKTKGDVIAGSIDVKKNGYFNLSIPYDEGFNIYADGFRKKYTKTNKGFIGFEISEGHHNILIKYKAPYRKDGEILSIIGISLFLGIIIYEKKKINR